MFHTLPARHKEGRMVRIAKEQELPRVNELRAQVNALHAAGRPDMNRYASEGRLTIDDSDGEQCATLSFERGGERA